MKVAVIGHGYVGQAIERFFRRRYEVIVSDPAKGLCCDTSAADVAVVCVPTPANKDGSCDTAIVEDVVRQTDAPLIVIKSTVAPGTTERLKKDTGKRLVFSPEYLGESAYYTAPEYPHPTDLEKHRFFVFGGDPADTSACVDLFVPVVGPHAFFYQVDATTAELVKYWENTWGAMKVAFCNEMALICERFGVDYWKAREGWALDSRVEKMHTAVFKQARGFGGKCFPKDVAALHAAAKQAGHDSPVLEAILTANDRHQAGTRGPVRLAVSSG